MPEPTECAAANVERTTDDDLRLRSGNRSFGPLPDCLPAWISLKQRHWRARMRASGSHRECVCVLASDCEPHTHANNQCLADWLTGWLVRSIDRHFECVSHSSELSTDRGVEASDEEGQSRSVARASACESAQMCQTDSFGSTTTDGGWRRLRAVLGGGGSG